MPGIVLVTGCSSGIGLCLARRLGEHGYTVLASARKSGDVEALRAEGIQACQLDLADSASIAYAVDWALSVAGDDLYALVNNGAYGQPGAVEDLDRAVLLEQFQANVFGTQELTNRIIPLMRKNNRGRIIQISSILGLVCLPFRGAYNASKYALEALTDTMRLELANTAIQVSLIEPGPIESEFRKNALKMFNRNIDVENSVHRDLYKSVRNRLKTLENARFTLPAEAVLEKTVHALDSPRPKIRYKVTTPAQGLSFLKRVLPDWMLDKLLVKSGDKKR